LALSWEKVKEEKRRNGYRPNNIAIRPMVGLLPRAGSVREYEFASEEGEPVRLSLHW
jgi:hypothetical protein